MHSGRMAYGWVLVTLLTTVLAVRGDVLGEDPRPLVLYLGHAPTDADAGFGYFKSALKKAAPELSAQVRTAYLAVPDRVEDAADAVQRMRDAAPAVIVAPSAGIMRVVVSGRLARTPVVFSSYMDPVRSGFVDSLRARSSPVTGIDVHDELDGKRLEILHEAYPAVREIGVIADPEWASDPAALQRVESESRALGVHATVLTADSEAALRALFDAPASRRYEAWYVPPTYLQQRARALIIERMRQWGVPCIFSESIVVLRGGLMSYAQDSSFAWSGMAQLVARILAGEPPGSIPIERPQLFELAVSVSPDTGAPPPAASVLARADVVLR